MKIAIIGAGISGLSAAYLLHPHHDITVYEKNHYLGGHSRTVTVPTADGNVAVDTGFIVFNRRNYPHLTGLFNHLQVPVAKSDMSFGVSIDGGWFEYGTQSLHNIMVQKRNLLRPHFWRMLWDIVRFNRRAKAYLEHSADLSMGECLDQMGMGYWFRQYYLLAMGGAIWSMPLSRMLQFPAKTFIRFFDNHGLLTVNQQPQWYTVAGGSQEYVRRLSAPFVERIKLSCGVKCVSRYSDHVVIQDGHGNVSHYDQMIFACHSDQALSMLAQPTADEKALIAAITYQSNEVILHSDTRFMPRRKSAWSSWVYLSDQRSDNQPQMSLSYWMNNLQPLPTRMPMIVTLNPSHVPEPALVHDRHTFMHPVFDASAIHAQSQLQRVQGQHRTWFCGAWQRYGFHEDGLLSAVNVAEALGTPIPWEAVCGEHQDQYSSQGRNHE